MESLPDPMDTRGDKETVEVSSASQERGGRRILFVPRWLAWSLVALLSWGVWALLSKVIGGGLSAAHTQALSTIGLLPVMLALGLSRRLTGRGNRLRGALVAVVAGTLSCAGNVAYYQALNLGGKAALIVPLTALYPVVTVILAMLLLKEKLNSVQTLGVLLSLAAIYLFNIEEKAEEAGILSTWLAYALIPIALWGITGLLQKLSTNDISGELSTLWFLAAFFPVSLLILLESPLPDRIAANTWFLVTGLGFFFALGNFALLAAFASGGKASVITPISALYPLASVPLAIFLLGEKIGAREKAGIALALVAGVFLSYERRKAET
jgi:drug/metabolite transporter (DMT)-like permease